MADQKQASKRTTMRRLGTYLKPYWFYLTASILMSLVSVSLTLYIPILTGRAVDKIIGPDKVMFEELIRVLITMGLSIAVTGIAQWVMNVCNNKMTYSIVRDVRHDAIQKIEQLPLKYIDAHTSGEIVNHVITDVDQFADGLLMGFTQLFTSVMTILGTLIFMLTIHPGVTLVVVGITPLSLFVASFVARKTYHLFLEQSERRGEQTGIIDEMIGNQKVVQAFSKEEDVLRDFDDKNERLKACSLKAIFFSSITNPATRFVNSMVYAGVGIAGAIVAIRGGMSIGQLTSFLGYANQYTKPFNEISGVITELQNAFACAGRIFALIDEEPQLPDDEDAVILENVEGQVDIQNVSFSYQPEDQLIIDLSLHVKPGQRIAIVGPTGCGKTTLINLLMRFYDVDSGAILVEEKDIRHVTRESLRNSYGMVLQDTWLKTGTIRENICMGHPDASEESMIEAAKLAHAHSFIMRLPQGYDTMIRENSDSLSQGQKQLLCIARVMLTHPPMLILDEATSSIDTRTEIRIQKAFHHLMEGRTSFIVAHRLSTIQEADVILVMKDGNIIEQGSHEELLTGHGFYYELYNSQFAS
ncbi:MAG: ABC transporter ATP-binding protein [Lachnospiraceae bacterium]|nr:ABC transporter ATP-binding protein [Lachnospiraceae bacterium]